MVLTIEETIQKLRQYRNVSFPIFSVYLQIPNDEKQRNKKLREQFQSLVNKQINQADTALYQQDLNYIAAYLNDYKHTDNYKGIAIFSGGNKLWEVITIFNKLPVQLYISHSPNLKPLLKTVSNYRRFLVVLADSQKARFFTMHMGQLEAQGGVDDPNALQKVKGQKQTHLHQHMKFIGNKVGDFVKNKQISGVIIGGHKELLNNLKENLPKHLQQKIVGEFISELNNSISEVLAESKKVIVTSNSFPLV